MRSTLFHVRIAEGWKGALCARVPLKPPGQLVSVFVCMSVLHPVSTNAALYSTALSEDAVLVQVSCPSGSQSQMLIDWVCDLLV